MENKTLSHRIAIVWIIILISLVLVIFIFGAWVVFKFQDSRTKSATAASPASIVQSEFDNCDESQQEETLDVRQHIIKLTIPAEIAGTASQGGFASFDDQVFVGVNPGDRVVVCVEFPDGLVVKGNPPFANLKIFGGQGGGASALGVESLVESEGTLKLKWSNGGLNTQPSSGTIHGPWINLSSANTPQDGQTLNAFKASFTVSEMVRTYPLQENQDITISSISWENLSSP